MKKKCFVITDPLFTDMKSQQGLGFWDGVGIIDNVLNAKKYESLQVARDTVKHGNFFDPVIQELDIVCVSHHDMYEWGRMYLKGN